MSAEEPSAVLYIPLPGLFADQPRLAVGDLVIERIDVMDWRLLENNRATDLYSDYYQALPRYYVVAELPAPDDDMADDSGDEPAADPVDDVLRRVDHLVQALLLVGEGDIIRPRHVVPCLRDAAGINRRPVPDVGRSRFLTTAFGPPLPVGDTGEELTSLGGSPTG